VAYNPSNIHLWDRTTPADGLLFNDEFERINENFEYLDNKLVVKSFQEKQNYPVSIGRFAMLRDDKICNYGEFSILNEYLRDENNNLIACDFNDSYSGIELDNNNILICYRDSNDNNRGKYIVKDIYNNHIFKGIFNDGQTKNIVCTKLSNGKVVICFIDEDDTSYGKIVILSCNGYVIEASERAFESNNEVTNIKCTHLGNNNTAIVYTLNNIGVNSLWFCIYDENANLVTGTKTQIEAGSSVLHDVSFIYEGGVIQGFIIAYNNNFTVYTHDGLNYLPPTQIDSNSLKEVKVASFNNNIFILAVNEIDNTVFYLIYDHNGVILKERIELNEKYVSTLVLIRTYLNYYLSYNISKDVSKYFLLDSSGEIFESNYMMFLNNTSYFNVDYGVSLIKRNNNNLVIQILNPYGRSNYFISKAGLLEHDLPPSCYIEHHFLLSNDNIFLFFKDDTDIYHNILKFRIIDQYGNIVVNDTVIDNDVYYDFDLRVGRLNNKYVVVVGRNETGIGSDYFKIYDEAGNVLINNTLFNETDIKDIKLCILNNNTFIVAYQLWTDNKGYIVGYDETGNVAVSKFEVFNGVTTSWNKILKPCTDGFIMGESYSGSFYLKKYNYNGVLQAEVTVFNANIGLIDFTVLENNRIVAVYFKNADYPSPESFAVTGTGRFKIYDYDFNILKDETIFLNNYINQVLQCIRLENDCFAISYKDGVSNEIEYKVYDYFGNCLGGNFLYSILKGKFDKGITGPVPHGVFYIYSDNYKGIYYNSFLGEIREFTKGNNYLVQLGNNQSLLEDDLVIGDYYSVDPFGKLIKDENNNGILAKSITEERVYLIKNEKKNISLDSQIGNIKIINTGECKYYKIDVSDQNKLIYFDNLSVCDFNIIIKGKIDRKLGIINPVNISNSINYSYEAIFNKDGFIELRIVCDGKSIFIEELNYSSNDIVCDLNTQSLSSGTRAILFIDKYKNFILDLTPSDRHIEIQNLNLCSFNLFITGLSGDKLYIDTPIYIKGSTGLLIDYVYTFSSNGEVLIKGFCNGENIYLDILSFN